MGAMVDTVERDSLMPMLMLTHGEAMEVMAVMEDMAVTAVDMEVMVDTDMVDTVERDPLMLNQKQKPPLWLPQKLMPMPGTDVAMEVTVLEVMVDTDMAVMEVMVDTVLDTVMVDTVARDLLMPGTDVVMDMAVMVDTAVDMAVMVVTVMAVDTEDTDMASNNLTTPKKP